MTRYVSHVGTMLLSVLAISCAGEAHIDSSDVEEADPPVLPARAFATLGSATVERADREQTFQNWNASFTVKQEAGALDTLELVLAARESGDPDADFINVTISRDKQLRRGALSLIGTYDITFERAPLTSGTVTLGWAGKQLRDPWQSAGSERRGTLTITQHTAGRITGTLSAALEDGTRVNAKLEGEVTPRCRVLTRADGEDSWALASFEEPFCAQYFFL